MALFTLAFYSCKKVAKEVGEDFTEKTLAKGIAKEASAEALEKMSKTELKKLSWSDLIKVMSKKSPSMAQTMENLDKPIQKALGEAIKNDNLFLKALSRSNSVMDNCKFYAKHAPSLMKDANFIRMFVRSDIARKEGKTCFIDNLIAKEEKGAVRFYQKGTNAIIAEYRNGIINLFDRSIMNDNLIPNICYTISTKEGKKCSYFIDDLGRIANVKASKMSPDEIGLYIINRTGKNDFGHEWDKMLKRLKSTSRGEDVNISCRFNYGNTDETIPRYAHMDCDVNGKKKVSSSLKNTAKRYGNPFTAEENSTILRDYAKKANLSPDKRSKLLNEMNEDNGLATLIHENPEFNIKRWLNARNPVDKKAIALHNGRPVLNAKDYAGNVYYFNPHINKHLKARMISGQQKISYEDLIRLDKKYPNGVPFSKEGFPQFGEYAFRGKDGKCLKVDIGKLRATSNEDRIEAEKIFQSMGYPPAEGYTWHHIENTTTLIRVPTEIHNLIRHTGGRAMAGLK